MKQLVIFLSIIFCLFSCNSECEYAVDLNNIKADVDIKRLEKDLFKSNKQEDIKLILNNNPLFTEKYLLTSLRDTQVLSQILLNMYTNPDLKEFYFKGEKDNEEFRGLREEIESLFKHTKFYYPSFHIPEVYTYVTGLEKNTQLFMDDSLIVIGIDHFFGKKAKFRPQEYEYMLERLQRKYIAVWIAFRLANEKFSQRDQDDETLLTDMVYWGKAHYFMKRIMPCVPDSAIIMYTGEQMNEVENNMNLVWAHFIENKLFYETKPDVKRRYVEESPKVSVIGEKCPGRIGRYLGWQIVKTYMEKNPEVTLQQLMEETDAQKIFKLSKYKPKAK
jgi:gliding motility-associated lipoprotein GldB